VHNEVPVPPGQRGHRGHERAEPLNLAFSTELPSLVSHLRLNDMEAEIIRSGGVGEAGSAMINPAPAGAVHGGNR
jgi:hypothetical protein